jgi:hypothetical protein
MIATGIIALLAVVLMGSDLFAQTPPPNTSQTQTAPPPSPGELDTDFLPQGGNAVGMDLAMSFIKGAVKGQPYTAETVEETSRLLADGTKISEKTTGFVARDSQGRIRHEMGSPVPANAAGNERRTQMILVMDPASRGMYMLMPATKMAMKMVLPDMAEMAKQSEGQADKAKLPPKPNAAPAGPDASSLQPGPNPARVSHPAAGAVRRESLGQLGLEGLIVEGTRSTKTIPVGEIGNDKAIEIVVERWYSRELQTTVLLQRNDPREGEYTFKLVNVRLEEPPASLFEIPNDYTIQEFNVPFPKPGNLPGKRSETPADKPADKP